MREGLARLPASARLAEPMHAAARRSAEAQLRIHAAPADGREGLERWARAQAPEDPGRWRELLAGAASSVLCLHALIAASADPRSTPEQGLRIDRAYLWIAALPTILDSLADRCSDARSGQPGFAMLYESGEALAAGLSHATASAITHARAAPHAAHHVMTLVGVLAYYGSALKRTDRFARQAMAPTARRLRVLLTPTLAVMRAWRLAKRIAARHERAQSAPQERTS